MFCLRNKRIFTVFFFIVNSVYCRNLSLIDILIDKESLSYDCSGGHICVFELAQMRPKSALVGQII